ncbi:MAG TPA: hypothetical protein VEH49_10235 [Methylomirabilota bacterium]|nr:hypothetical protein [Methylomirabilota bacterium]
MKRRLWWLAVPALALAFAAGCGPAFSLFGLCTADDKTFDDGLLGVWKQVEDGKNEGSDATEWRFDKGEDGLSYDVTLSNYDSPKKGRILSSARLVRLGGFLFIDFEAPDGEKRGVTDAVMPALPAHCFGRITFDERQAHIALLDDSWIEKQVKAKTMPLAYLEGPNGRLVTAKTDELRKFALAHAEDKEIFGDKWDLVRKK